VSASIRDRQMDACDTVRLPARSGPGYGALLIIELVPRSLRLGLRPPVLPSYS